MNRSKLTAYLILLSCSTCNAQFLFQEEGYRFNPENKSVYRLTPNPMPWTSAQGYAISHSIGGVRVPGDLVTIRNQSENDWLITPNTDLTTHSPRSSFWIGFTEASIYSPETGVWVWVSEEPGTYRAQDMTCSRFCGFAPGVDLTPPAPDVAIIHDFRGDSPGSWAPETGNGSVPGGWYGIVEFVEPFAGAHDDSNENGVPDTWEDNNFDGVPDGYEDGGPIPAPRNLRAGFGLAVDDPFFFDYTVRLVWEPADSPDLLGYNIYHSEDPSFAQSNRLNGNTLEFSSNHTAGVNFGKGPPPNLSAQYFRVESVLAVEGEIQRGFSNIAAATPGEYVLSLPEIRGLPGAGNTVRYPVSLINARGITVDNTKHNQESKGSGGGIFNHGDILLFKIPPFLENVTAEKTPLTKSFPDLIVTEDPAMNQVSVSFATPAETIPPLNGEGALFNLVFDIAEGTPLGTMGEVRVLDFVPIDLSNSNRINFTDRGAITVDPRFRPGDVDGSGVVTEEDAFACALLSFGAVPHLGYIEQQPLYDGPGSSTNRVTVAAGDVNGDGSPDILDVNQIIAILIAKGEGPDRRKNGEPLEKGVEDFRIKLKDTPFSNVPGSAEMEVEINMPPAESEGIAGAAFTVSYATEHVELMGVELDGEDFNVLFFDQRDYSRGWKAGRVKVIVSSGEEKVINGKVAKVKFDSVGSPPVPTSQVPFVSGKMAKSSGEDIAWTSLVDLEEGTLIFSATSGININVYVDNIINASDLLIYVNQIRNGTESGEILNEFSKEWLTPRP